MLLERYLKVMKRKAIEVKSNEVKRAKLIIPYIIDNTWVSASETRNYGFDPFSDWVKLWWGKTRKISGGSPSLPSTPSMPGSTFVMQQGNIFESNILSKLKQKFSSSELLLINGNHLNARSVATFNQTCDAIKNKVPIIYGGVLHNPKNKTYGVPDLIVRRDYLPKIFTEFDNQCDRGVKSNRDSTYAIVDIKFSTIPLRSGCSYILNTASFPAYKRQLSVYNDALSEIHNYFNPFSYILGRGIKFSLKGKNYNIRDPFHRCGVIDFSKGGNDNHVLDETRRAVNWMKDVKLNGDKWDPFNPHREEMYPNMCSLSSDTPFIRRVKEKVAKRIGEITEVWMCGESARKIAHSNGVYSWKDERCNSKILGIRDGKIADLVDAIIDFNRECSVDKDSDTMCIRYDTNLARNLDELTKEMCVMIDFEISSNISADSKFESASIFMIGLCYTHPVTGEKVTNVFSTKDISPKGEESVCEKFIDELYSISTLNNGIIPTLVHWSPAERWRWEKFVKETTPRLQRRLSRQQPIKFLDMCEFFKDNHIIVNGCLNFKLKNIAKRLYELECIPTTWSDDSSVSDGLGAIVELHNALSSGDETALDAAMKNIETYNRTDVEVLSDILDYLYDVSHAD
jgi:hypothetical protein